MIKVRLLLLLIATIMLTSARADSLRSFYGENELVRLQLHGPVRTMRVEIAICAKGVTNPRRLAEMYTFDTHGNSTSSKYNMDSLAGKAIPLANRSETKYTYNEHGKKLRDVTRCYEKGKLTSTLYNEYTYDQAGRLKTFIFYGKSKDRNPRMKQRITYTYDAQNRLTRTDTELLYLGTVTPFGPDKLSYSSTGALLELYSNDANTPWCRHWFNTQGLKVKSEAYKNGKTTFRALTSYNKQGDEVRMTRNDEGKQRCTVFRNYYYDQHGNWTQRTVGQIERRNGKDVFVTSQIEYRTFTYY